MTQGDPVSIGTIIGYRKSAESIVSLSLNKRFGEGMNSKLNSDYLVGLVDGEGCFSITINNHIRRKEVRLIFEIEMREDDKEILERVQKTLHCGNLYYLPYKRYKKWRPHYKYKVSNIVDISRKIIPFFRRHPLQAKKKYSFEAFCKVAEMIQAKQHLSTEGIKYIQLMRNEVRDSLNALDAHVQWGVE